jgi:hypothetical protein
LYIFFTVNGNWIIARIEGTANNSAVLISIVSTSGNIDLMTTDISQIDNNAFLISTDTNFNFPMWGIPLTWPSAGSKRLISGATTTWTSSSTAVNGSAFNFGTKGALGITTSDTNSFVYFYENNVLRIGQVTSVGSVDVYVTPVDGLAAPPNPGSIIPLPVAITPTRLTSTIFFDIEFRKLSPTTVPAPIRVPGPTPVRSPAPIRVPPPIPIWLDITFSGILDVVVFTERAGSNEYYYYSLQYSPNLQFRFWDVNNLSMSDRGKTVHILTTTGYKVVATLGTIEDSSKKIDLNFKRTTVPNPPEGVTTRHRISRILISSLTNFDIDLFLSLVPPPGQLVPPPCPAHSLTNTQNIDDLQEVQIFTYGNIGFRIEPDGNCYQVHIVPDNPTSVMVSVWTNSDPNIDTYTHVEANGILFEIRSWGTHKLTAYTVSPVPITAMVRAAEIYIYRPAPFGGGTPPGMVTPAPFGGGTPPGMVTPAPFGGGTPPGMVTPAPFGGGTPPVPPPPSQIVTPSVPPSAPFSQTMVTPVVTFKRSGDRSISVKHIYKSDGTGYRHVSNQDGSYSSKGPFFTYTAQGQKIFITYTGNAVRTVSEVQPTAGSEPV